MSNQTTTEVERGFQSEFKLKEETLKKSPWSDNTNETDK
jgi:hypothetical protein